MTFSAAAFGARVDAILNRAVAANRDLTRDEEGELTALFREAHDDARSDPELRERLGDALATRDRLNRQYPGGKRSKAQDTDYRRASLEAAHLLRAMGYGEWLDQSARVGEDLDAQIENAREHMTTSENAQELANDPKRAKLVPAFHSTKGPGAPRMDAQDIAEAFTSATRGAHVSFEVGTTILDHESRAALTATGGSAVPTNFADFVTVAAADRTPLLNPSVVRIIETLDGAPLVLPQVTAYPSTSGAVVGEGSAIGTANPTVASITLNPYKYANLSDYTSELSQDNVIRIQELLAETAGFALGNDFGAQATTGDGSSKPHGIVAAAGNGGTALGTAQTGGANFFGWPDLVTLYGSVPAAARNRGAFLVSSDAFTKILSFRDSNGQPVALSGALSPSGQPTLLGRPIIENPDMAAVGSASKSVVFGDLSRYVVQQGGPLRVEISPHWQFGTDIITIKVVGRWDSDLLDTGAVKYLVSAAT